MFGVPIEFDETHRGGLEKNRHNLRSADTLDQMKILAWLMIGKRLKYSDLTR